MKKKIPKIWNPNLNYYKILEKLEESALEDIPWRQKETWKLMGFEEKLSLGWDGFDERQCEGNVWEFEKLSHLLHLVWKQAFFAG